MIHTVIRTFAAAVIALGVLILSPIANAQATLEQTLGQLSSKDPDVRIKAVRAIKGLADPAAAVPLTAVIVDPENEVQLEAIAAELNVFLADPVTPTRRVGFIVEVRGRIAAEPIFTAGPSALGPRRVPLPVATALVSASHDNDPRVALEAIYALGALGGEVPAADRAAVLAQAAPVLGGLVGAPDPGLRLAALRVAGQLFARRPGEPEVTEIIGDAAIAALNDREDTVREGAMWALGSMKYTRSVRGLTDLFRYYRRGPFAEATLDALARIGHDTSLPEMVEQLSSKHDVMKVIAIEGLARIGDKTRAQEIHAAIANERGESMMLAGHFAMAALADGKLDAIVEATTRNHLQARARQYLRELAIGRAPAFAAFAKDPNPRVRQAVIEALGASGDHAAAELLTAAQQDADPGVARAAIKANALLR